MSSLQERDWVSTLKIMALANSPSKNEFNGHTFEFVTKVPDELICKLCTNVLRDPRQVVCCGTHFCHSCIERRIMQNYTCPNCQAENFNHFRDTHFEQRVGNLKIHCPHFRRGCKWIGELSQAKQHLTAEQGCPFEAISCPTKCGQQVSRRDLREHMTKQCTLRKIQCQYCNHENTFYVITGSHSSVCPNYPVPCPNKCGIKGVKRSELNKHELQCPMRTATCPYSEAGCKEKLFVKDVAEHMANSVIQHLGMVSKAFESFKERAETAEKEAEKAHKELAEATKKAEDTQQNYEKTLRAVNSNAEELVKTCTESQKVAVQSIRSLTDQTFHVKEMGKPVVFQMVNYSELKRMGRVWYSAPIYVQQGYKMCLAVYANGVGIGEGSCLSIALCLMKGEFDDELQWPVNIPFNLTIEILKQGDDFESSGTVNPKTYMFFAPDKPQHRVLDAPLVEVKVCENLARHQMVEDHMLFYDAITFQITPESEFL
ncbi:hypothetical protein EMCRGX_G010087 [Ephydatia muelleri]